MKSKRRGRGEGTVEDRGGGKYRLRIYVGSDPVTGRPLQTSKTITAADKRGALKELRKFASEVDEGNHPQTGPDATVGVLFDHWLPHLERRGRAQSTLLAYETVIRAHLRPFFGDIPLSKLTAHDIDAYYLAAQKRGLADRTIRQHGFILSGALSQAVDWDWLAKNPAQRASPPVLPQPTRESPSPDDVRKLIDACGDDIDLATAVAIGALTGARRGELCGLKWSDVDWVTNTLLIERQRVPLKGGDQTVPLKNKKPRRVALGPGGLALLRRYLEALEDRAAILDVDRPEDAWLLSYDCGFTPIRSKGLGIKIADLGRRAGVPMTTHLLRYFAATQMVGAGVDVRTAAGRLGHTPEMLLRVYAGFLPQRDMEAAKELERALGSDFSLVRVTEEPKK